ncbi:MAG: hypothetical protein GY869_29070 [Planctomycetes bacterium]|nr:hypothetical protein [Planctomycetota bacterium]
MTSTIISVYDGPLEDESIVYPLLGQRTERMDLRKGTQNMEPLNETTTVGDMELQQDAWGAYKTFRGVRFLFFLLTFLGLLNLQASFWAVDRGIIDISEQNIFIITSNIPNQPTPSFTSLQNQPQDSTPGRSNADILATSLNISNYATPFCAFIYCLTLLIGLKIALVGRLGGLTHSSKAFFLSLIVVVLVMPWLKFIDAAIPTAMFGISELAEKFSRFQENNQDMDPLGFAAYYGRFCGLWLLAFLLLLMAQFRSFQAAKRIRLRLIKGQHGKPASIVAAAAEVRQNNIIESLEDGQL